MHVATCIILHNIAMQHVGYTVHDMSHDVER